MSKKAIIVSLAVVLGAIVFFEVITTIEQTSSASHGVLQGKIISKSNCSLQKIDQPCVLNPEFYASKEIVIYKMGEKKIVARTNPDSEGNYKFNLSSGTYGVAIGQSGIDFNNAPLRVDIKNGVLTTLDINIDTPAKQ